MNPKPKRGGSRPGAGRHRKPDKRVCLTVSLPVESKAVIQAVAKAEGVSASELVKRWSDSLLDGWAIDG